MTLIIRKCTISEIENAPNISELLEEYANESSIKGLPHPFAKADTYKHLENTNSIYVIGAFIENMLIGYIIMLSPILPHYSTRVAVVESFFVQEQYRKTGAGLKLLHMAENQAKDMSAYGILVSAPFNGSLTKVLPNVGYQETNRIFFRNLKDE